jgi:hypothetical protein
MGGASVKSDLTYSSGSGSSTVTHPPPFSKHSTAQGQGSARPALRAVWWGAHTTHHHLCRPQVPEAGPRLKPAGQQTADGQQKGQQRPGAHAARRIAHTPSAPLDSLAAGLLRAVSSSCNLSANWRAGGSTFQENLLVTAKRSRCICMTIQSCLRLQTS